MCGNLMWNSSAPSLWAGTWTQLGSPSLLQKAFKIGGRGSCLLTLCNALNSPISSKKKYSWLHLSAYTVKSTSEPFPFQSPQTVPSYSRGGIILFSDSVWCKRHVSPSSPPQCAESSGEAPMLGLGRQSYFPPDFRRFPSANAAAAHAEFRRARCVCLYIFINIKNLFPTVLQDCVQGLFQLYDS